ncbi:hypothetical protein EJ05DRAFT_533356 [Pseudovirgaria hyperparasitica]|uniref:Uncharacterized protein n=1 Tax=Pseudovirgaria hyperparasitica TaxID=470096 RepID=A0A6A6VTD5_9PEZI|nr:uncharacterized protein EJ05DRAFT_533356 [Pseudovirgaria hyperparasitica]KAF2753842.1 hypothetical protein EJ05DRAFT_533356 [Pseudovirgaria hyperparasitica]
MVLPNTAGNPLSAGSLAAFMAASLPSDASPQLRNGHEAVALAVNACMIAVGFRLVALGKDQKLENEISSDNADTQRLPKTWNTRIRSDGTEEGPRESYAFTYAHAQSAMRFEIQVNQFRNKAMIHGEGVGDDRTASCEVIIKDFLSESSLPSTPSDTADPRKTITDVFISSGRLMDLSALFKVAVIQKLAPGITKPGYSEEQQPTASTSTTTTTAPSAQDQRRDAPARHDRQPLRDTYLPQPARPHPFDDPLAMPPRGTSRPLPEPIPGFDDEHEILRGPGRLPQPGGGGARAPFSIGHDDLYPPGLGPNDPIRPGFGGGLPRPGGMGGGMHPTFDDPLFGGGGGAGGGLGGYDPSAPPGARYDPVGPGGAPRDRMMGGGGRFPGGGGGMGGRPPNPFGGFGDGDFI